MLAEIKSLLVLQDRDQRILKLKSDTKQIPADKERAQQRLASDTAKVADAKKATQENEMAIKTLELDIGTRKNSLERMKTQQFETKKNEEFTALGNEIKRYSEEIDDYETSELELMEKADELRALQKKMEAALTLTQGTVTEEITTLDQRAIECKKQLEEVQTARKPIAEAIDKDLVELYERLMKSKGGDAIVEASNNQCTGCHMKLVPATMIQVQAKKEVTQCENCGRILYL